jgi:plastocyanin
MFEKAFIPQTVTIDPGDAVSWLWRRGEHTVTSGLPDGAPGTQGQLFDAALDAAHAAFSFTFSEYRPEGIPFFCRRHPEQVGFIEMASGEATFRVAVVDDVFNPEELFIFQGDSVLWEHEPNEGFHTVTSGVSSIPEENPGALFDEESSDLNSIFVYRFTEADSFPYFCRPHEAMGMKGVIHVEKTFVRGDSSGEGVVDISDAVAILGFLFLGGTIRPCADALDANDDGIVNIGDPVFILNFLFTGGVTIPKPYPRPGADRSEDGLHCSG